MKSSLLPHTYKKIGWLLFIPSVIAGPFVMFYPKLTHQRFQAFGYFGTRMFQSEKRSPFRIDFVWLYPNLVCVLLLIGGMLVMFSKEKKEDEYINQLRLNSLQNSVFFNYIFLFFAIVFIHGVPFFQVMSFNLFTVMIFYILRFHFLIYKNSTKTNE
jgi:hypothetical protein